MPDDERAEILNQTLTGAVARGVASYSKSMQHRGKDL
jgi:hypothetical protein